jgi:hypothetical protein
MLDRLRAVFLFSGLKSPFAREHTLNVSVQCPHDPDAREHRWAAQFRDQDQGLDRCLPCRMVLLGFGQLRDVRRGVL